MEVLIETMDNSVLERNSFTVIKTIAAVETKKLFYTLSDTASNVAAGKVWYTLADTLEEGKF